MQIRYFDPCVAGLGVGQHADITNGIARTTPLVQKLIRDLDTIELARREGRISAAELFNRVRSVCSEVKRLCAMLNSADPPT